MSHLPLDYLYLELSDIKGSYGYCGIEFGKAIASFHFHPLRWSHNVCKAMREDFKQIIFDLKSSGINRVVASFANVSDSKWPRFINLLGFPKPQAVLLSTMEI